MKRKSMVGVTSNRGYLYTKALSDMGSMMELIVMNTVIFSITKSSVWLAAVLGCRVFGGFVSSLFSGVMADRTSRKHLMVASDVFRGLSILLLCIYPAPFLFLVAAFVIGVLGSFYTVSFSAEMPQMFGEEEILNINARVARLSAISMVLGFIGAALLSIVWNFRLILVVDAGTYFLSGYVLRYVKWNESLKNTNASSFKQWLQDVKGVYSYCVRKPVLLSLFIVFLFQTFAASTQNVGIPLLARKLDPENLSFYQGLIWGGWGVGSVLSTWLLQKVKGLNKHHFFVYLGFSLLASLGFIFLLTQAALGLVLFFAFLTGMFDAGASTYLSTILQQTNNGIRGRIFGVSALLRGLGFSLGFVATSIMLYTLTMPRVVLLFHGGIIGIVLFTILYFVTKKVRPTDSEEQKIMNL